MPNGNLFIKLHRDWNIRHRCGAPREVTAALARKAGYDNGQRICWMFRHGLLVTRPDGRWVADLV